LLVKRRPSRLSFLNSGRIIEPISNRLGRIQHFGAWNSFRESADLKFDDDSDETLRLGGSLTREFFGRACISVPVSRIDKISSSRSRNTQESRRWISLNVIKRAK